MITQAILEIRSGEYFGYLDLFLPGFIFYLDKFEYLLKWLFNPIIISTIKNKKSQLLRIP